MADTLSAYFLCAGYGKRLRPLTDRTPKPALTFQGKTALEINYRRVQPLFPARLLCNTHHLYAEMEKPALRLGMRVLYEAEILGTGGCLWNARHLLQETDRMLVHNGDLIHTVDLKDLLERHKASGAMGTLAGLFRPQHNTLSVGGGGRLLGVHGFEGYAPAGNELTRLTFAGIAVYEKAFLEFVGPGEADIKPYWAAAMRAGHTLQVINYSQAAAWYDFGTPQGLWEAAKFHMETTQEYAFQYTPLVREMRPYVSNEAGVDDLPEALHNVLIYEEPASPISHHTGNQIIGRDFRWEIRP
jgi:NDP-sugar pyrophosphorylase family protein